MLHTNTDQANIETKVRAVISPVVANRNSTRVPWRCICTDAVLLPQSSDSAEIREAKEKEKQKNSSTVARNRVPKILESETSDVMK